MGNNHMTPSKAHLTFIFITKAKDERKRELVAAVGMRLRRGFKEKDYAAKRTCVEKSHPDTCLRSQSNAQHLL